ncbi:MAG: hypothetical protein NT001_03940 [Candidatus Woesearchaeota archaeon]|nr:hypothetical protein [Candidatus Woesearchaeota archaeon]
MSESFTHQKLKIEAKQLLLQKGYSEDNILVDKKYIEISYYGFPYKFRIDVYGANGHQIAIECGNFPKWKHPIYEQYFGKEFVIHIPYEKNYGKYLLTDLKNGQLTKAQGTQFLMNTYKKHIYDYFKDDPIFDFQEFNDTNRNIFDIDGHRAYREINPDYIDEEEVKGRDVWMNFPDSNTLSKAEYKDKIHWGMIYYTKNKVAVTIIFSGRSACEKFLGLSDETHKKIFEALKVLPPKFKIRDGNSFWDKTNMPPLDKVWNNPIPCHELTWEQYKEICENLDNLIRLQKAGHKVGPVLDLAKVFCQDNELPEVIEEFRELYKILLKSESEIDIIAKNIKTMDDWKWYISQSNEWNDIFDDYCDKFGELSLYDFKKACRKLRLDKKKKKWTKMLYTLSPSTLNLFKECLHCFWMQFKF